MIKALTCRALAGALLVASPITTYAQEESPSGNDNFIAIGAGAVLQKAPFKGSETKIYPIPVVTLRQGIFYVEGIEAGIALDTSIGEIQPAIKGFVVARATSGTDREKLTADGGLRLSLKSAIGVLSAEHRRDISSKFNGGETIVRFSHPIALGKVSITPGVQVSFQDRKTANYMYGITAAQRAKMVAKRRTTILPVYTIAEGATNLGVDLSVMTGLSDRIMLFSTVSGTRLDKSIRKNPNIERNWEGQALLGIAYRF
jgi:MipA family protein